MPNRCPHKAKKANYPNLQTFESVRGIMNKNKKIFPKIFCVKKLKCYIKTKGKKWVRVMKFEFDDYEKDVLLETIQHRLDTDKMLIINDSLRKDVEDLFQKIEEDEYL